MVHYRREARNASAPMKTPKTNIASPHHKSMFTPRDFSWKMEASATSPINHQDDAVNREDDSNRQTNIQSHRHLPENDIQTCRAERRSAVGERRSPLPKDDIQNRAERQNSNRQNSRPFIPGKV